MPRRVRKQDSALEAAQGFVELADQRHGRAGKRGAEHARIDRPAEALALELARQLPHHAQADLDASVEITKRVMRLHQTAARGEPQAELLVLLGGS